MMDDLDELGYEEIKHRFDRGDYHDPTEIKSVKKWLSNQEKEQEFIASCKRKIIGVRVKLTFQKMVSNFHLSPNNHFRLNVCLMYL